MAAGIGSAVKPRITVISPDPTVASARYRALMPWNYLQSQGWGQGDDLLLIGKHCWPVDFTADFDRYVFDVCDDHFGGEWRDHYLKHCENAVTVVCNSEAMREIIREHTGREAIVIPDPVEYPPNPPHTGNVLWFGNKWNVKSLYRVLPHLPPCDLEVVSEPFDEKVTPWTPENMQSALKRAGIVVIPVGKKQAKSANRLITALNGGCFVACEALPAHCEFSEYVWIGDIGEGVRWAQERPQEAFLKVRMGQEYIQSNYTMEQIGPRWEKALLQSLR
jgi:hypothetical protein